MKKQSQYGLYYIYKPLLIMVKSFAKSRFAEFRFVDTINLVILSNGNNFY